MRVTATEAKNRFGSLCAKAKLGPVFVEKAGQLDTVILSAEQYQALQANQDKASRALRKKAFEAEFWPLDCRRERPLRSARHSWRRPAPVVSRSGGAVPAHRSTDPRIADTHGVGAPSA